MQKLNNFSINCRIYYEDTDAGAVVYYANYLKFFERARTEFLRSKGINQQVLADEKSIIFVVKECKVKYISPAKLDDLISVSVEIKEVKKASVIMQQKISLNEKTLSELEVEIVCINNKNFRPARLSEDLIAIFS